MDKLAVKIDKDGFYLEDVMVDNSFQGTSDIIIVPVPPGFNLPKWDGEVWVEGKDVGLDSYKDALIKQLSDTCENTIYAGFDSTAVGHKFSFGPLDQLNFTQKFAVFTQNPKELSTVWKTEDAGLLVFTREQFFQITKEAENFKMNLISKYWKLKEAVKNAKTFAELNAIRW
ncbi:hypothetical protein D3C74_50920 [compost metagenome]